MSLREGKIGTREGVAALTSAIVGKALFPAASLLASGSGNTAWLVSGISAGVGLIGFLLALYVLRDGGDLLDGFRHNLGFLGRFAALALCSVLVFNAAGTLGAFYSAIKRFMFSETEPLVLLGLLTLAALVPAFMGFECVARSAKCFFAILLGLCAVMLILPWKQYDASRLFPLLGEGGVRTLWSGASGSLLYVDLIAAAVLIGPMQGRKQLRRVGLWAFCIAAALASLTYLCFAMTFSSKQLSVMTSPLYNLSSFMTLERTLTRAEDFVMFLWLVCTASGTAFSLYVASNVFCRTCGVDKVRPVVPLMAAIALLTAFMAQISPTFGGVERFIALNGFWVVIIPIALAAFISFLRRRKIMLKLNSKLKLFTIFILALFCTACQDMKSMDDEAYALALGIDSGKERKYAFTAQIPSQTAAAAEKGGFTLHRAEADSIYEAMDAISTSLPWRLNLTHLNCVVFGGELAKSGAMGDFAKQMPGRLGIRATCSVVAAEGAAYEFLEGMKGRGDINLAKHQRAWMLEPSQSAMFPECTLAGFAESLENPIMSAIVPVGTLGADGSRLMGCAVFKDGVIVKRFDATQTLVLMLARGEFQQGWYYHSDGTSFAADLQSDKPRRVRIISWNPLTVRLNVFVSCEGGTGGEEAVRENLREDISALFEECRPLGVDAFQLGKSAVISFATNAQWEEFGWMGKLKEATLEIMVEVR